ncbi:unnamed protein product [Cunninghamella blakesleeana]
MSSTDILSTQQLNHLASKLTKENDRDKYINVISLSNRIQEKIHSLRLERNHHLPIADNHSSTSLKLNNKKNKVEPLSIQTNNNKSPIPFYNNNNNNNNNSSISIKPKPTCPLPPTPTCSSNKKPSASSSSSSPINDKKNEKQQRIATSLSLGPSKKINNNNHHQNNNNNNNSSLLSPLTPPTPMFSTSSSTTTLVSLPSPIELQHKALPSFPLNHHEGLEEEMKRAKHDTIYDTTCYYYEKSKKAKVTFAEQVEMLRRTPSPFSTSSLSIATHSHPSSSFLLMTPPDSPNYSPSTSSSLVSKSFYNEHPLPLPPINHVQKRVNGLRGLLTRTYQLNEIISSKTLISPFKLYNGMDTTTREPKAILRITMITKDEINHQEVEDHHLKYLNKEMLDLFGFTFNSNGKNKKPSKSKRTSLRKSKHHLSHSFMVSNKIVADALSYWIDHQKDPLPALNHATHILRESVKLYVVYDRSWFH